MSLTYKARGFMPLDGKNVKRKLIYQRGADSQGVNSAVYPGDLLCMVAAGAAKCVEDTASNQGHANFPLLAVAESYMAAGGAGYVTAYELEGTLFEIQSSVAQSSLSVALADIGSLFAFGLSIATYIPDTTNYRSGNALIAKDTTNGCAVLRGISLRTGNDLTSAATNFPILVVQFLNTKLANQLAI